MSSLRRQAGYLSPPRRHPKACRVLPSVFEHLLCTIIAAVARLVRQLAGSFRRPARKPCRAAHATSTALSPRRKQKLKRVRRDLRRSTAIQALGEHDAISAMRQSADGEACESKTTEEEGWAWKTLLDGDSDGVAGIVCLSLRCDSECGGGETIHVRSIRGSAPAVI